MHCVVDKASDDMLRAITIRNCETGEAAHARNRLPVSLVSAGFRIPNGQRRSASFGTSKAISLPDLTSGSSAP